MNRIKQRLIAICQPKPAPWKRLVLWIMSPLVLTLCIWGTWEQMQDHSTSLGAWIGGGLIIGILVIWSIAGIIAAAVGDDWWVAILVGDPD